MDIKVLASGSKGNAYPIDDGLTPGFPDIRGCVIVEKKDKGHPW